MMRASLDRAAKAKKVMGVQQILEWAFGRELARIEVNAYARIGGIGLPTRGAEHRLMERMQLGGIKIDTSIGQSLPHDDAEIVAAILENLPSNRGGLSMAISIAEFARCGSAPDWMPEARPRIVPLAWRENQHGRHAATALVETIKYRHRGRLVKREVRCCPVTVYPSASKIAAARRNYLDWWRALSDLRCDLQLVEFKDHVVSDVMPEMKPWIKKAVD